MFIEQLLKARWYEDNTIIILVLQGRNEVLERLKSLTTDLQQLNSRAGTQIPYNYSDSLPMGCEVGNHFKYKLMYTWRPLVYTWCKCTHEDHLCKNCKECL